MTISYYDQDTPTINGEHDVEVTALYFRNARGTRKEHLESYPRRMVYEGREYNFLESGMHYLVQKGQQLIKLFDVSDGNTQYRLRLEDNRWTLIGTRNLSF
ncbi:MAG: hypothetical protein JWM81_80 [Candidatus Saccharibacteria bacterium]|nr:hypothetical protein [Candidatus Saccharibacteria bacterium]